MKKIIAILMIVASGLTLSACTDQDMGTMGGAAIGGLVGSRFGGGAGNVVATGAGAVVGAVIGNAVGKSMDEADQAHMNSTLENNAAGQPAYWKNQNTGTTYNVVPVRNVTYGGNRYCREYRSTAVIAGKTQQVYGKACRQPDGSWKIIS